jgi:hypothetical protein
MHVVPIAFVLSLAVQQAPPADSAVARAREALKPLTDSVALRDAGYFPIGFGAGTRDLTPFQGQHWVSLGRFVNNLVNLSRPTFMMYLPVNDSLIPIGVAHTQRMKADSSPPTALAGTPALWHVHIFCRAIPGEGQALADGADDCKNRGGTPAPNMITMVHVWTIANPDGPYAHDNPALPFIATGLTPPAHATPDDRLFGVALGETYGAKLVTAHRIDRDAGKAGTRSRLDDKRAPLRELVPRLREAERANDTRKFAALRKQLIASWSALADEYRALAATPEIKARFDADLRQALGAHEHQNAMN